MLLKSKHQGLIDIIRADTNEPFGQFLADENNDKANGAQGYSNILNHPPFTLSLFWLKVYKSHDGFQDAEITAETSSINGNY